MPLHHLPDFVIGPLLGLAINLCLCLLVAVVALTSLRYRLLLRLSLFYLSQSMLFLGVVGYGLQPNPSQVLLWYGLMLAGLSWMPFTWVWFADDLIGVRRDLLFFLCLAVGVASCLALLLIHHPLVLGLPLEYFRAGELWRPQSQLMRPALYSFAMAVAAIYTLRLARLARLGKNRPGFVLPMLVGLFAWVISGLHDVAFALGVLPWPHQILSWIGSLVLSVCLTLAVTRHFAHMEDAVHREEARLRAVVDGSSDALVSLDRDLRVQKSNPAFLAMFKVGEQEVSGGLGFLFPDRQAYERFTEQALTQVGRAGVFRGGLELVDGGGGLVPVEISLSALGGGDAGYVAVLRDVTEQRRAARALIESEEHYRTIFDQASNAFVVVDHGGRVRDSNRAARETFGYDAEQFRRLSVQELVAPELREGLGDMVPSVEGNEVRLDSVGMRRDGSQFQMELRCRLFNIAGEPHLLISLRDVTEEQLLAEQRRELDQARELFESVFQCHTHPLLICRLEDGRVTMANPAFQRIWGYPAEDMAGSKTRGFYADPAQRDALLAKLKAEGRVTNFLIDGVRADGTTAPCEVCVEPVDVRGEPHVVVTVNDVSRRQELEHQLRQAQKMEAVGTLASGVAHDFNNILQTITGSTELMARHPHPAAALDRHLPEIGLSVERAADLVRRLLTFSRRAQPGRRPLDLNRSVTRTVETLRRTIPRMIDITTRLAPDLWTTEGDEGQLEQVLINLGANARDAMPEGGELVFATENLVLADKEDDQPVGLEAGRYVRLTVSDNGVGMDQEVVAHIFEPFFTTKDVGKGTGLGLSTAYGIVRDHRGHISCLSRKGVGTMFTVLLPAALGREAVGDADGQAFSRPGGKGELLLLVDDEEAILRAGAELLEQAGYRVMAASGGEAALELYNAQKADLVILDLNMPGMSGTRCLGRLRELDPEARVLIASGQADKDSREMAAVLGAVGFLPKPYQMDSLLTSVRRALEGG